MKHIFVVNPAAGRCDSKSAIEEKLRFFSERDIEVYVTSEPRDAERFVREKCEASQGEEMRFYACGGDGTINEVASGAVGFQNASISVLPVGSGNDYVKYYGGKDAFAAIGDLMDAGCAPVDLMRVNDRYSVNVCNFGFDTSVVKTMLKVKRITFLGGKAAYLAGVATSLFTAMKTKCRVLCDGEEIASDRILLCTIANGSHVGGSFNCAPKSRNDDGLLEVCLVKPISRFTFLRLAGVYAKGKHLDDPKFEKYITYRQAKSLTVDAPEGFCISVDGELIYGTHFDVEVMPGAIRFAVPKAKVPIKA